MLASVCSQYGQHIQMIQKNFFLQFSLKVLSLGRFYRAITACMKTDMLENAESVYGISFSYVISW